MSSSPADAIAADRAGQAEWRKRESAAKAHWTERDRIVNTLAMKHFDLALPFHMQITDAGEVYNLNVYAVLTKVKEASDGE